MHRSRRLAHTLPVALSLVLATGGAPRAADLTPDERLEPAAPFHLVADAATRERARDCLAAAIYYEAGDQTAAGREAVAQVVLNRLRHPAFPKSLCAVVYQGAPHRGCQFTFACDGSLTRRPPSPMAWTQAQGVADRALDGYVASEVGAATHYHALYVRPAWSGTMSPTAQVGLHRFYRYPGSAGLASALTGVYAGVEAASAGSPATGPWRVAPTPPAASGFSVWGLRVASILPRAGGAVTVANAEAAAP